MSKVHIELSMDKKQLLVAFLQDVDGNMDTYRKHVRIRNAFDLENFELFCDAWRAELRILNGIVVGSRVDVILTMRNIRYQTYRSLFVVGPSEDDDESVEVSLPAQLQERVGAAERTDYEVPLQLLRDLQADMAKKKWNERRGVNQQTGKIETVDRIVTMDEAQVIVEFDELLSDALNVREESEDEQPTKSDLGESLPTPSAIVDRRSVDATSRQETD